MTVEELEALALRKIQGQKISHVGPLVLDFYFPIDGDPYYGHPIYRRYLITYRQQQPGYWIVEKIVTDSGAGGVEQIKP